MSKTDEKRRRSLERLRLLRPIDDDFMRCLFKDNIPLAQLVLRIITGKPDLVITSCQTQKDMKRLAGARSLCLDAYGVDSTGRKYDLEIQRADKGAAPRRARYHSSVMDVENLDAGQDFSELPETYIIFILEKDIYARGKPLYAIERMNLDTGEPFGDGEHILYVNGEYRGDTDLGRLMHDFGCADAGRMKFDLMAERTRYLKESPKGVGEMCKVIEDLVKQEREEAREEALAEGMRKGERRGLQKGLQKGILEGAEKTTKKNALRMLKNGKLTVEEIMEISGLSLAEVKKLQATIQR